MKVLVLLALVGCATALVLPKPAPKKDDGPNCGLRDLPALYKSARATGTKTTFLCEMCLDLVEIAEMYADCDESYADQQMDKKCDSYFHTGLMDKLCRDLIDDVYHEVKKDTDKNPSKTCTKITKAPCSYAS